MLVNMVKNGQVPDDIKNIDDSPILQPENVEHVKKPSPPKV
jgi:hypothetical protein